MAQSVDLRQHQRDDALGQRNVRCILDSTGQQIVDLAAVHHLDEWRAVLAIANDQPGALRRLVYTRWVKPTVEWLAALALLVLSLPIMLSICVALLLTTGRPILFCQPRVGRDGRMFTVYKFRTMIADRRSAFDVPWDGVERRLAHKTQRDPRVTRVGRLLRRTSLDELPQLFNVLRGDMALVGPRPEIPRIVVNYAAWQHQRHLVRPGITGWWQVNGRSDRPMHENTEMDLYYINHISPWLDLLILLRTLRCISGRGAF